MDKLKTITIWTAGYKGRHKLDALLGSGFMLLMCICASVYSFFFPASSNMTVLDHVFFGIIANMVLSVGTMASLYFTCRAIGCIRNNKLINLYICDINTFAGLGGIPCHLEIVFIDKDNVVFCDSYDVSEYNDWVWCSHPLNSKVFLNYDEEHNEVKLA